MAYWLAPLSATQVTRVRSPARHTVQLVWKNWVFSVTLRPGTRRTHCHCIVLLDIKFAVAKAKGFPHLEAWVRVGREIIRHVYHIFLFQDDGGRGDTGLQLHHPQVALGLFEPSYNIAFISIQTGRR
jgi:hypothetical protein